MKAWGFPKWAKAGPKPPKPPVWDKVDPVAQSCDQAKIAKAAADLVGVFSLFALVTVFAGIASDKRTPIPIPHLFEAEANYTVFYLPWMPAFIAGALGVWIFNRHGLRILLTLQGFKGPKEERTPWTKLAVFVALVAFAALIIVTATKFQDTGVVADARDAAIVEQRADQGRAALEAERDYWQRELDALTATNLTTLQAQAARDGSQAWSARVAIAREQGASNLAALERAQASADRADEMRAEIMRLEVAIASAPVEAETAATVAVDRGATEWIADAFSAVPLWFAIATEFLALIMKLVEFVLLRRAQSEWRASQQQAPAAPVQPPTPAQPAPQEQPEPVQAEEVDAEVDEDAHEAAALARAEEARARMRARQASMPIADDSEGLKRPRKALDFDESEMVNVYHGAA